jgi:RNA-splicing ligase RtcB
MDIKTFNKASETEWRIEPTGAMRVPAVIHAGEQLIREMDDKVREQLVNVTMLPGIVRAAYAMPDAHWGYGFPIGGVAAFDPDLGGVISAGGVGFDTSCGVRTHLTGNWPGLELPLLYDVSHNMCKPETHEINGQAREVWVHRKGATRSFGPGHDELPEKYWAVGQPVLIGGSMGTASYVLAGMESSEAMAFSSACHGAGRSMSRTQARRRWQGRQVVDELAKRGIIVRSPSSRGVAEEAPGAYKDVAAVVKASEQAGLARRVARLKPVICIKG